MACYFISPVGEKIMVNLDNTSFGMLGPSAWQFGMFPSWNSVQLLLYNPIYYAETLIWDVLGISISQLLIITKEQNLHLNICFWGEDYNDIV